ncbi:uncharacterized protein At1g08160-like [Silene latifolia]|uniref:uncharacterized protein At1g08160-like n=1 Tax=Silene latifolia TaxID=37657 RepID=UPI003D7790C4
MTDPTRPEPVSGYPAQPTNGYPQHPPPPQQPQQPNYYYPNPNPNQYNQQYYPPPPPPPPRTIFYRRVMSALILTFIILAIILFIIYLILRPRVPIFTITSLSLSSLNLTTSPTPPSLSATWTAIFQVTNPNTKLHVYYEAIEARVFYDRSLLALNQLPPFDQPVRDQTAITARLTAASAYIEPDLGRDFSDDRSKGNIKFDVQVFALVRFKAGGWRARRRGLRAFCDGLIVNVNGSSGGLSGGPRRCAVGI